MIGAISEGSKDEKGNYLNIGETQFQSRSELKSICKQMLATFNDGPLGPDDEVFVRLLLQAHPFGAQKARGCTGIQVGTHETFKMKCFFVTREDGREDFSYVRCIDNLKTQEVEAQEKISEALCSVLELYPTACEPVAQLVEDRFPLHSNAKTSVELHRNFVHFVLFFCVRLPVLTEFFFALLVRKMIDIDLEISKLDDKIDADVVPDKELDRMAQILDAMMMLLFEFMQRHLAASVVNSDHYVKTMLTIFENTVLLTHKSRCVQFIYFYITSLKPAWSEEFLSKLLIMAYSEAAAPPKRLLSVAYLASFIARASFLTTKYTARTTQYLCQFARENLPAVEHFISEGNSNTQVVMFLASLQAVCYILCFKAEVFALEIEDGQSVLQNLLLGGASHDSKRDCLLPVLESPCRPLSRIPEHIAKEFCRSIRTLCPSAWTAARESLAQGRRDRAKASSYYMGSVAGLESCFPFDPYRLRHSSIFINGTYQTFVPKDDDDSEDSDAADSQSKVPGGFAKDGAAPGVARRQHSRSSTEADDEAYSDADFTEQADATVRGFIPSVGPSPAFGPRRHSDMVDMSPLGMPMDEDACDDLLSLPPPSVDPGSANAILSSMLSSAAYSEVRS